MDKLSQTLDTLYLSDTNKVTDTTEECCDSSSLSLDGRKSLASGNLATRGPIRAKFNTATYMTRPYQCPSTHYVRPQEPESTCMSVADKFLESLENYVEEHGIPNNQELVDLSGPSVLGCDGNIPCPPDNHEQYPFDDDLENIPTVDLLPIANFEQYKVDAQLVAEMNQDPIQCGIPEVPCHVGSNVPMQDLYQKSHHDSEHPMSVIANQFAESQPQYTATKIHNHSTRSQPLVPNTVSQACVQPPHSDAGLTSSCIPQQQFNLLTNPVMNLPSHSTNRIIAVVIAPSPPQHPQNSPLMGSTSTGNLRTIRPKPCSVNDGHSHTPPSASGVTASTQHERQTPKPKKRRLIKPIH